MSDIDALQALTSQMTQEGIRRLLVISGDAAWCRERAEAIRAALPGDWLWVAPDAPAQPCCTPQALQTLLGREFRHAILMPGRALTPQRCRPERDLAGRKLAASADAAVRDVGKPA
ncbi:acetyltransferase [Salmonella enterica subsp. enterica serovar Newport str. VA_R100512572]|nr:acetyltransferase [Salmonella enterica subsp. enterica serovar Newport str. VA_R100512572]